MKPISALMGIQKTSGMRRLLVAGIASASLISLSACGGGSGSADRGPTTIPVSATLNGLHWSAQDASLYLSNDAGNNILTWTGGSSFRQYAALPKAPESGATLGQVTATPDGTLYVTRFGFGIDGAVIAVPRSGVTYNLSGLDNQRRRIGVTATPDGGLIDGWFIKGGSGAVSELKVNGKAATEREIITGLGKPVGLAVVGDDLFVSDQNTGNVLAFSLSRARAHPASLADGRVVATFTTLDGIDLMTHAPNGTLFFGGTGGKLFSVSPQGQTKVLASGWPKIKGVAYDAAHRRLFAAVVAADANSSSTVRIVPID